MRRLADLHPDIESKFFETYSEGQFQSDTRISQTKKILEHIDKVIEIKPTMKIAVVGCGPAPLTIKVLSDLGHDVVGIEPLSEHVKFANEYLNGKGIVLKGFCEKMELDSNSIDIIFCESVMEHVDSPELSVTEFYRVLKPGGLVYISTENRLRFSIKGYNSEYRVSFYNFFPASVKEGYINLHLNKKPHLASFSPLPAVHWYTYSSLCRLGRYAGFGKFYSLVDVVDETDERLKNNLGSRILIKLAKKSPWIRSFLLRQIGGTIFMYKRKAV